MEFAHLSGSIASASVRAFQMARPLPLAANSRGKQIASTRPWHLVDVAEMRIEIEQLLHGAQPLADAAKLGCATRQLLEEAIRKDVGVNVYDHGRPFVRLLLDVGPG